jgi:hypothetical protein
LQARELRREMLLVGLWMIHEKLEREPLAQSENGSDFRLCCAAEKLMIQQNGFIYVCSIESK